VNTGTGTCASLRSQSPYSRRSGPGAPCADRPSSRRSATGWASPPGPPGLDGTDPITDNRSPRDDAAGTGGAGESSSATVPRWPGEVAKSVPSRGSAAVNTGTGSAAKRRCLSPYSRRSGPGAPCADRPSSRRSATGTTRCTCQPEGGTRDAGGPGDAGASSSAIVPVWSGARVVTSASPEGPSRRSGTGAAPCAGRTSRRFATGGPAITEVRDTRTRPEGSGTASARGSRRAGRAAEVVVVVVERSAASGSRGTGASSSATLRAA
jgi:hypothetical protein